MPEKKSSLFIYHEAIHNELKSDFLKIKNYNNEEIEILLREIYEWISTTPKITSYRINLLKTTSDIFIQHLQTVLIKIKSQLPTMAIFPLFPELCIVNCWNENVELDLQMYKNEIIVDSACGSAVLRGSHVFAPGIIGIPNGLKTEDRVSVFADITGDCKKGFPRKYENEKKMFIGNGIIKQVRNDLFSGNSNSPSGIAIFMTDVISRTPQLSKSGIPPGWALLQNLPAILCSRILDPQPNEIVLDMCSAPGNKTTHISQLMDGKGTLIAVEKIKSKIAKIKKNCELLSCSNVNIFCYDSTKAVCDRQSRHILDGPPFKRNTFDRILLDTPCSALGQRPQLQNRITVAELRSYSPLQKKLFSAAVQLLKPGGTLVYSTCTITIAENEEIVSWGLRTYPELQLQSINNRIKSLGLNVNDSVGYVVNGLTEDDANRLYRCRHGDDTIGFFIACFIKKL